MATYATLTINAEDIIGADFDRSRASVWVEANTEHGLIVVDGTSIRVGGRRENLVDGVATFQLVTTDTADNPTSFGYRVTIVYVPKGSRKQGHDQITTSDFPLTASANLAAIPEAWDNVTIPPSWRSEFRDEMEALRDSVVDLSGIATPDGVVAALVASPTSGTKTALTAAIAAAPAVTSKADAARVATLPTAAATAKPYDQRTNLYNLQPHHLRKTRAKLAAAESTAVAKITCLGSSIAAGQGATNKSTQAWPHVLRDLLTVNNILPSNGTGWVLSNYADSGFDERTSRTGTWTKFVNGSDRTVLTYATGGASYTFASDKAAPIMDVKFSNLSSTWVLRIDGAFPAAANVSTTSGVTYNETTGVVTAAGGSTIATITVSNLSNATHTVLCSPNSGTVYLAAFRARTTTGLQVSNMGLGGARCDDIIASAQPFGALALCTADSPDLVTVDLMTNEAYLGTTATAFETKLTQIVTTLKSAACDVLLIAEIPAGGNTLAGPAMDLTAYRAKVYAVSVAQDVPVLDLFERWGSYTTANTNGQMSDIFHPTTNGYRDYARAVRDAIRVA